MSITVVNNTYTITGIIDFGNSDTGIYDLVIGGITASTNFVSICNTLLDQVTQTGSLIYNTLTNTQTVKYIKSNLVNTSILFTTNSGTKSLILSDNTSLTTNTLSGNGTVFVGNDSKLIVNTSVVAASGIGTINIGCDEFLAVKNGSVVTLPSLTSSNYNINVYGNNCVIRVNNCTNLTIKANSYNNIIIGTSNTITIESGSSCSQVIGTNTITDNGAYTQYVPTGSSVPAFTQSTFGNLNLNGNVISSLDLNGNIILTPNGTGITTTSKGITVSAGNIVATLGNISAAAGSISANTTVTAGTGLIATTGGVTASAGNIVATLGNISAVAGSISANTTVTAGTGLISTTGGVTASAGNIVATLGNISAAAGSISANTTVTAGTGLIATTGGVTASAGGVTATAGNITATSGALISTSGNINIGGSANTITSTNSGGNLNLTTTANGNLNLIPNGTGQVLLNADPTANLGAVTKQYVDFRNFGRVVRVDSINGLDVAGAINGRPFLTINAALTAAITASSGGTIPITVLIYPGTYTETITAGVGLTIPNNIDIIGIDKRTCIITCATVTTTATTLINIPTAITTLLQNLTLNISGTGTAAITGVTITGNSLLTARLDNININVTKTTDTGSANVTGILSNGNGQPAAYINTISNINCIVSSTGTGRNIALTTTTAAGFVRATDSTFVVSTTTGSSFGVESNFAGSIISLTNCQCFAGTTTIATNISDISQTLGTIHLNKTNLINSTANGLSFTILNKYQSLIFGLGATNSIANGIVNFYLGTNTATTANNVPYDYLINTPMIITNMYYKVRTTGVTGAGQGYTFNVLKNNVITALTLSISNTNNPTSQTTGNVSVNFQPGDLLSLQSTRNNTPNSPQGIRFILTIF